MSNHKIKAKDRYRLKLLLAEKYGYRCIRCGKTDGKLTLHHKIKVSDGGSNVLENLSLMCPKCHKEINK